MIVFRVKIAKPLLSGKLMDVPMVSSIEALLYFHLRMQTKAYFKGRNFANQLFREKAILENFSDINFREP